MKRKLYHILTVLLFLIFLGCAPVIKNPVVVIETTEGSIRLELFPRQAPVTVANFLSYVDRHLYDGASFYRVLRLDNHDNPVLIEVIQGGLDERMNVDSLPPIPHEATNQTGVRHKDGVISMARYGPGTATSEFFICIGDQPGLDFGGKRNPDGYGFAAFGKVTQGMEVVRKIQQGPTAGDFQRLIRPVEMIRVYRR